MKPEKLIGFVLRVKVHFEYPPEIEVTVFYKIKRRQNAATPRKHSLTSFQTGDNETLLSEYWEPTV